MASTWAKGLPMVRVGRAAPKRVSFVYPYYDNPDFLRDQVTTWVSYSPDICGHLTVILVDDGSPTSPAAPVLAGRLTRELYRAGLTLRQFRIDVDVPWNWLAARNIGMDAAADGWCLLTDMDHVVPLATAEALVYGRHDPARVYAFSRVAYTGEPLHPHSASFLLTRATFWQTGGYDEALSGHYGTDGEFRRRLRAVAPMSLLQDSLIRYEGFSDASTARYPRKSPEQAAAVTRLIADRPTGWAPRTLSFPYHEVR